MTLGADGRRRVCRECLKTSSFHHSGMQPRRQCSRPMSRAGWCRECGKIVVAPALVEIRRPGARAEVVRVALSCGLEENAGPFLRSPRDHSSAGGNESLAIPPCGRLLNGFQTSRITSRPTPPLAALGAIVAFRHKLSDTWCWYRMMMVPGFRWSEACNLLCARYSEFRLPSRLAEPATQLGQRACFGVVGDQRARHGLGLLQPAAIKAPRASRH